MPNTVGQRAGGALALLFAIWLITQLGVYCVNLLKDQAAAFMTAVHLF